MTQYVLAKNLPSTYPHAGGQLKFYAAGTNNPIAVHSDSSGTAYADDGLGVINITAAGRTSSPIYLDNTKKYKCEIYDSAGTLQNPVYDNIIPQTASDAFYPRAVLCAEDSAADAIKFSINEEVTWSEGLHFTIEIDHGANETTSPTVQPNSLTAKTLKRGANEALLIGDTGGIGSVLYCKYSAENDCVILLNPYIAKTANIQDRGITAAKHAWIPLEWRKGLVVSNNVTDSAHDIDITAGSIGDDTQTYIMECQAMTKRIDAVWAAGTGNGGLSNQDNSGAVQSNTFYGVFALHKSGSPSVAADSDYIFATTRANALADTNVVAAGYDIARLIDVRLTDSSSNIINTVDGGEGWRNYTSPVGEDYTPSSGTNTVGVFYIPCPPFHLAELSFSIGKYGSGDALSFVFTQTDADNIIPETTSESSPFSPTKVDGVVYNSGLAAYGKKLLKVDEDSEVRYRGRSSSTANNIIRLTVFRWKMDYTVTDLV